MLMHSFSLRRKMKSHNKIEGVLAPADSAIAVNATLLKILLQIYSTTSKY